MHSFHAFIDEAGDEGFTFKEPPERASSEWFVISAYILRADQEPYAARELKKVTGPIEARRKSPVHFRSLPHEARVAVINAISRMPARAISVCFNKKQLGENTLGNSRRLYFYCTRFLLERVSWMARDRFLRGGVTGDGRCKLTFSHCKNLSYEELTSYLERLRQQPTQIAWDRIDHMNISVKKHENSIWLRSADALASGVAKAFELSDHGFCEDRYALTLKRITYERNGNYLSYGLKIFPAVPQVEADRDNRYEWLNQYR